MMFKSGTRRDKTAMTEEPVAAVAVSRVERTVGPSPQQRLAQPDRKAAEAAHNAQLAARQVQIAERNAERRRQELLLGPVGQARTAFERGDPLFQLRIDVESHSQSSIVVAMMDDSLKTTRDPNEILNAVANEGWRIVSGSFVARHELVELRDHRGDLKESTAQRTTGYYVFERASLLGGG